MYEKLFLIKFLKMGASDGSSSSCNLIDKSSNVAHYNRLDGFVVIVYIVFTFSRLTLEYCKIIEIF